MAPTPIRLKELAAELGRAFEGDGDVEIRGVAALESAGPGDLAFARSARHARQLAATKASAVILPPELDAAGRPAIRSPQPGLDFARSVQRIVPQPLPLAGVDPKAHLVRGARVHPSARVGPHCAIGRDASVGEDSVLHPGVVLYDGVSVGANCVIHANCVLREGTAVGDRVILQPGVVLGGDGFGYQTNEQGDLEKVPQIGRVVVEDDVEIGAGATVDRGTLGETRIGRGAKLDNLVQVGHNCSIGEAAIVIAQAGIAGSTAVERGALIMAQAGVSDHVRIGERAFVAPQSGVHSDVAPGARVMGSPQRELPIYRRIWAALAYVPSLLGRVRAIERRLGMRSSRAEAEGP